MGKDNTMDKKKKHIIVITSSIILASLIVLITIVLTVTLTLPTGYKLVFNVDGQVTSSLEVKAKDEVVIPDPAAKDGYTFGGWYFDKDTFTDPCTAETLKDKKLKGENTIYAKWIKNDYTITYDTNGGIAMTDTTYDILAMPNSFAVPTKTGYDFAAWYDNAEFTGSPIVSITKDNIGNKTLYAKWDIINYTITYNGVDGADNTSNPSGYTIATPTITLAAPTKLGYTFLGWFSQETDGVEVKQITSGGMGTVTVFARWEIVNYGITYELNGGNNDHNNVKSYDVTTPEITLNVPTHAKNWMSCDGWFTAAVGGEKFEKIPLGSTGELNLYAHWSFTGTPGLTYAKSADNLAYEVSGSTVTGAIGIPSKHENAPVKIAAKGFKDNTKITSVVIDEGVTSIEIWAFSACSALASVTIPNSVTSIVEYAFLSCVALTSVVIPNGVTSIENYVFYNCISLENIFIPNRVTSIGEFAFTGCRALTSVTIPSSVQSIGIHAFEFCTALTSIFIPSSVTTIGLNVFIDCTNLTISCERASSPLPSTWNAQWMGNVPTTRIKWSQPAPKLVP